ncbi:MAG TPA: S9 family peptidase [Saprospiraceae bacterium]|nr:S9 family peptidase [Saprospiraceae bacterium]
MIDQGVLGGIALGGMAAGFVSVADGLESVLQTSQRLGIASEQFIALRRGAADANIEAEGKSYYHVAGFEVTPGNQILAYAEDTLSRRIYTIRFKNLVTSDYYSWAIPQTSGNMIWSNDGKYLFFVEIDQTTLRPWRVKRWSMENPTNEAVTVFTENDETYYVSISTAMSGRYLFINSSSTLTTEEQIIDLDNPEQMPITFLPRKSGHEYRIEHAEDFFYIHTNEDGRNFCLKRVAQNDFAHQNWDVVVPHDEDSLLEDFTVINGHLIYDLRKNANHHIVIRNDAQTYDIPFEEGAYLAFIGTNADPESKFVRINYTSLTTPTSVMDFDFYTREMTLRKQEEITGGYDKTSYTSKRLWVTGRDGVKIPVSLVYNKHLYKPNQSPLLLYGYGSYGHSIDPSFGLARLSLLDRGFVYAIAHIRGGEEMGRAWYENGRQLAKMNTFYDFIDCGKELISQGYCHPEKLYAMGGSAGGLLMGAVVNLEPQLWAGIVAAVPFVDVLTTMLDDSIPLTTGEYDEWGNPNIKEYYEYMAQYSPYDNIQPGIYPPMLVTTGLHDSQVQYWEPAKWVAKIRDIVHDSHLIFLNTNMDAGHGGASGRFRRYDEIALQYAFLIGLNEGILS